MLSSFFLPLGDLPLAFIDGVGGPEMLLIFVIVLLLFGGEKLPEFARGLGKTMRELRKAASGVEEEFKRAMDEDERKRSTQAIEAGKTTPESGSPTYPEDGSTDYSSEAGPSAVPGTSTSPTPAAGPADAAAPTGPTAADGTSTASPAPAAVASPATPAAPPPKPVVNEDYP